MEITEDFNGKPFVGFSGRETNYTSASLHFHNFSQILFIERGISFFEGYDSSFIQSGGVVYIPKMVSHRSIAVCGEFHYRSLYFLDSIKNIQNDSPVMFHPSALVISLIYELTEQNSLHSYHSEKCYDLLVDSLPRDTMKKKMLLQGKSSIIKNAIQTMIQHAHLPNCLEIVNSHHPYSSRHFSRLFLHETGVSLREAWTSSRMELADTHLKNGQSILETSLELGYSSLSGFYRDYKRVFKTTPKRREDFSG